MKNIHTERVHITASPILKKSIQVAAHSRELTISEYIRGLVCEDLIKNSEGKDGKIVYSSTHELP